MVDKNHESLSERTPRQSVQQPRKTRVFKSRWLTAAEQGKAPLSTDKCLVQLESILARVKVHSRRGRTMEGLPVLHLTLMQKQALEECIELLQLKLRLQRGETISRNRER